MPGYPMQAGFDQSSLMSDPKFKQQETMNQGNMVSQPYFQANKMAAEKTNPMNAISQETPVGDRVDDFLNRNNTHLQFLKKCVLGMKMYS